MYTVSRTLLLHWKTYFFFFKDLFSDVHMRRIKYNSDQCIKGTRKFLKKKKLQQQPVQLLPNEFQHLATVDTFATKSLRMSICLLHSSCGRQFTHLTPVSFILFMSCPCPGNIKCNYNLMNLIHNFFIFQSRDKITIFFFSFLH